MTNPLLPASADVVVVGGGIIGLACAEALACRGFHVVLLERSALGDGASGACQTGVGYGLFMDPYDLLLCRTAVSEYEMFAADGADVDYCQSGALSLCEPADEQWLREGVETTAQSGIQCLWVDQASLRELEPYLAHRFVGAALLSEVGSISPLKVVAELARRAFRLGVRLLTDTELVGAESRYGKVTAASTSMGRIATERIVVAAGAWSSQVGRRLGLCVPVWPLKGNILVTEPMPTLIRHLVTEIGFEKGVKDLSGVEMDEDGPRRRPAVIAATLQSQPTGQLLIGSSQEFAGYDSHVDLECLQGIALRACGVLPALRSVCIIRTYAGLRPWTPDARPLIGPTQYLNGLFFAAGHGGEGITHGLLTGRLIAEIMAGEQTVIDVSPLSPDRFALRP